MRTAEEIIYSRNPTPIGEKYEDFHSCLVMCINEARIEAIKECADLIPICHVVEGQCGYDRKKILSLIEQVK